MRNVGLDELQAGIKTAGRNIHSFRYADDTTLMAESEEELKSLLISVKEESERAGLKLSIKKPKIMASGTMTAWQTEGANVEVVTDSLFSAPKSLQMLTAALKSKMIASWQESYDKPRQRVEKQRHYSGDKSLYSQGMVFPVVTYSCEIWTVKKAEHQRINAFSLWCWRRLLRAPWTARRSNQSILREINPEYSLEGLMLKLKLQYFGFWMQTADSLEKSLMLEKTEGRRRRHQRMRWLDAVDMMQWT